MWSGPARFGFQLRASLLDSRRGTEINYLETFSWYRPLADYSLQNHVGVFLGERSGRAPATTGAVINVGHLATFSEAHQRLGHFCLRFVTAEVQGKFRREFFPSSIAVYVFGCGENI